jgi:hypothetical protein
VPPPLIGEPMLDRPLTPPPGWFTNLEVGVVGPHVKNQLNSPVNTMSGPKILEVPTAPLEWTGSPRIGVGYQLADNMGRVLLTYTSVVSQGTGSIANFDAFGAGFLRSRLNMNVIDLDYVSNPLSFCPQWTVDWAVGVRLATLYFDSQAVGGLLGQRVANNFIGAGPHGWVDLRYSLPEVPGLSLLGRIGGSVLIGDINQSFEETVRSTSGVPLFGGATRVNEAQAVPELNVRFGVEYVPPVRGRWMRFSFGYEFDYWWNVGNVNLDTSREDISWQGLFFRGEFSF